MFEEAPDINTMSTEPHSRIIIKITYWYLFGLLGKQGIRTMLELLIKGMSGCVTGSVV
jgi:hypothetical protein